MRRLSTLRSEPLIRRPTPQIKKQIAVLSAMRMDRPPYINGAPYKYPREKARPMNVTTTDNPCPALCAQRVFGQVKRTNDVPNNSNVIAVRNAILPLRARPNCSAGKRKSQWSIRNPSEVRYKLKCEITKTTHRAK